MIQRDKRESDRPPSGRRHDWEVSSDVGLWELKSQGVDPAGCSGTAKGEPVGSASPTFLSRLISIGSRDEARTLPHGRSVQCLCYVVDLCVVRMASVLFWGVDIWNFPLGPGGFSEGMSCHRRMGGRERAWAGVVGAGGRRRSRTKMISRPPDHETNPESWAKKKGRGGRDLLVTHNSYSNSYSNS